MDAKGPLIGGAIVLVGAVVAVTIVAQSDVDETPPIEGPPVEAQARLFEDAAPLPAAPEPVPAQPVPQQPQQQAIAPAPPPQQQSIAPAPSPPQATAPARASIAGAWHDEDHLDYFVQQQGNRFTLVSALGAAAFAAEGLVEGNSLRMQGGSTALGVAVDCSGRVVGPPQRLQFNCSTSVGQSFSAEYHRPGEG
jgi:hypothetical protein